VFEPVRISDGIPLLLLDDVRQPVPGLGFGV
jgi:uncharacterized protein YbaR (Trm112 family)